MNHGGFPDKLKIAIPLFKDRVSPYFGSSGRFLLMDIDGDTIIRETLLERGEKDAVKLLQHLVDLRVDKVICGGIPFFYKECLMRKGIMVVENQQGKAVDVVKKVLKNGR